MSRVYVVTVSLQDEDPESTTQKINAIVRVAEEGVEAVLPLAIGAVLGEIQKADRERATLV